MKFKKNEIVRIKKYSESSCNKCGRIIDILNKKYWVSNLNMPFCGTVSQFFKEEELEKI